MPLGEDGHGGSDESEGTDLAGGDVVPDPGGTDHAHGGRDEGLTEGAAGTDAAGTDAAGTETETMPRLAGAASTAEGLQV